MRTTIRTASLAGLLLGLASPLSASVGTTANVFDRPSDKRIVTLPADPENPQARPKRSCSYYRDFMVKEVDLGEPGAERLSFTPLGADGKEPKCAADNEREITIKSDDWSGYFDGAKGNFVFFDADDGHDGGMPFAVFTPSARKLFEDIRHGDDFKSVQLAGGVLTIVYRRVFVAPCSLYADAKACWDKIVGLTSLERSAQPDCRAVYEKEMKRTPKFAKEIRNGKSVIAYDTVAKYAGGRLAFTPTSDRVSCWLED